MREIGYRKCGPSNGSTQFTKHPGVTGGNHKTNYMTNELQKTTNAMTVDVEDYFQVSAFEPYVSREKWKTFTGRVEANTDRILEMFDEHDVKATFFTLGLVAKKYPQLVKRIVRQGHEIASHGWDHRRVTSLTRKEFTVDTMRSKKLLEDASSTEVVGYRAPSYSFTAKNDWAHDVLLEQGYLYSSSIAPIKHDHYGIPGAARFPYSCANNMILELPITTTRIMNRNFPCGGGGWFRLYPYKASKWAIDRVNTKDNNAIIFYFHPWEIDPDQPRVPGLDLTTRFRHYQNLAHMERKIIQLLSDFKWRTIPHVFASELNDITRPEIRYLRAG